MKEIWEYISVKGKFAVSTQKLISMTALVVGLFHILLWAFYIYFGITEMAVINVASMIIYVLCYDAAKKGKNLRRIFDVIFLEIVFHSILATTFVGIDCGFLLYLIAVIPIGYYVTYTFREISQNVNPIFYVITAIIAFWGTRISQRFLEPKYNLGNFIYDRLVYMFNYTAIVLGIVAFCSTIVGKVIYLEAKQNLQNMALEELSKKDPLTGLFNRRSIQERYERAQMNSEKYAIIIGDIDDFKRINDTYGHNVGDEVLKVVSDIYKEAVRSDDIVCRWGGEEILVFLSSASKEQAVNVGTRILERIRSVEMSSFEDDKFFVTMTLGVATSDEACEFNEAVRRADTRLYVGKSAGKNQIVSVD